MVLRAKINAMKGMQEIGRVAIYWGPIQGWLPFLYLQGILNNIARLEKYKSMTPKLYFVYIASMTARITQLAKELGLWCNRSH